MFLLALLLAAAPAAAAPRPDLARAARWTCFYGANLSTRAWTSLDMAVVDPDSFVLPASSGPVRLAYVSAGEADERRSFWPKVRGRPWVIEPNPEWPGAHRVDVRSAEWRKLLIGSVVPAALAKGYQGVMLDTLDVAEHFESSAPARFPGSLDAAAGFVLDLRAARPDALILVNNGLPLLPRIGPAIDGVLVEDLYTSCLPGQICRPSAPAVRDAKEAALTAFVKATGRPVFVLVYARLGQRRERWVRSAVRRAREKGFLPYLADPALERLGVVAP